MKSETPLFSFTVISDIQLTNENELSHQKLAHALQDLYELDKNSSALIMNGDLVADGQKQSYEKLSEVLESCPHTQEMYFTIGNHEFFQNDGNVPSIQRFLEFSKLDKVYYERKIAGHPFIFLGSESWGPVGTITKDSAVLSEEQLDWLSERMEEHRQGDKPVFVFLHQPLPYSLYGTDLLEYYQKGIIQNDELKNILSGIDNVFYFSGHSHFDLRFPNSIVKEPFTMINTGAIYDIWGPDGEGHEKVIDSTGSQGLYLQVYTDKVVIKGRDFTKKQWIAEYQHSIPL